MLLSLAVSLTALMQKTRPRRHDRMIDQSQPQTAPNVIRNCQRHNREAKHLNGSPFTSSRPRCCHHHLSYVTRGRDAPQRIAVLARPRCPAMNAFLSWWWCYSGDYSTTGNLLYFDASWSVPWQTCKVAPKMLNGDLDGPLYRQSGRPRQRPHQLHL
mmetsp:Transcript_31089/g.60071  ORF Transcript_31089/g.60071 Transcript_31089/m.60071 type:complete len:157 (+) Transcript_31089:1-471(+)